MKPNIRIPSENEYQASEKKRVIAICLCYADDKVIGISEGSTMVEHWLQAEKDFLIKIK